MTKTQHSAFEMITAILACYGPVTYPRPGETRARCPAHDGESADSLKVTDAGDKVLIHCFADCDSQAIVTALDLAESDLFNRHTEPVITRHNPADEGMRLNAWVSVLRRAELDATTKLVALMLASYANADGTHVYPGVTRLAVECGLGQRTVQRIVARLRQVGLLQRVSRGNRRAGQSDEYRLIAAFDLLDRLTVLSKDAQCDHLAAVKIRGQRRWRETHAVRSARSPAIAVAGETGSSRHSYGGPPSIERNPPVAVRAHAGARAAGDGQAATNDHATTNGHKIRKRWTA
jgi:hypothetical protein